MLPSGEYEYQTRQHGSDSAHLTTFEGDTPTPPCLLVASGTEHTMVPGEVSLIPTNHREACGYLQSTPAPPTSSGGLVFRDSFLPTKRTWLEAALPHTGF